MRDANADLSRRHLLDRVRLVENNEIVWKQKTALALCLLFRVAQQYEEQRVIHHDQVRGEKALASLLVKTVRVLTTGFLGAEVRFAADLVPDFRIGLYREITQRTVAGRAGPFCEPGQFILFRTGEKLIRLLPRALQPARAKIILPPFHEPSVELDRQNLF